MSFFNKHVKELKSKDNLGEKRIEEQGLTLYIDKKFKSYTLFTNLTHYDWEEDERFRKYDVVKARDSIKEVCKELGYKIEESDCNLLPEKLRLHKYSIYYCKHWWSQRRHVLSVYNEGLLGFLVPKENYDEVFAKNGLMDKILEKVGLLG